jgi:CHAD domain-containing protein
MALEVFDFYLERDLSWSQLIQRLREQAPLRRRSRQAVSRTFHDSFDWRLYREGTVLEEVSGNGKTRMILRSLGSGAPLNQIEGKVPRLVQELPPGALRDRLEPVMAMRAFLPVVVLDSRIESLDLLNGDGSAVVCLNLEENAVRSPRGERETVLPPRVAVMPVKGHGKALRHVVRYLRKDLSLRRAEDDLMIEALHVLGVQPGNYSSKHKIDLDPASPASGAMRRILLNLLDIMEINEEGVRKDLDSEFLHDFRVAVRRTRSALGQVKSVFPKEALARFKPEFAWLGAITGPTRDLDVYLLSYDAHRAGLPDEFGGKLYPLHQYLVLHQQTEQQALARELEGERYRKLIREWRDFLQEEHASPEAVNAARPVEEVASERIWKVYRRTLKEGRAIDQGSRAEELHELRKTCKRLRYLLEFFQSLYPPKDIRRLIRALKTLQDNLGEFQDLQVQSKFLCSIRDTVSREENAPVDTLMAMGILVGKLQERQRRARTEFTGCFRLFSRSGNERLFKRLFEEN